VALSACLAGLAGCAALGFAAAAVEEAKSRQPKDVEAEYDGLRGKTFAVVVTADRVTQGDHPNVVPAVTTAVNEVLAAEAGASGYIPSNSLLAYLYENPRWVALPPGELANELGVERLVVIDLQEYRLNEPGNRYLWSGVATGIVSVAEADGPVPNEYAYQDSVSVSFPDDTGFGREDFTADQVQVVLLRRFVDRVSWLFYDHVEPGGIEY